jgi:outer membrane protein OmpA-like peptidoglycan-associated protein
MSQEFGLQPVQSGKALLLVGMSSRDAKPLVVRRLEAAHVERPSPDEPQTDVQKVLVTLVPDGKIMGDAAVGMATVTGRAVSVDPSALIDEAISWDGHPALTPNGRWIVFASDRSGSLGGADLWYAPYSSGLIGAARPLYGANTACDELTPSVTSRGMLLFSSPGHTSHGGYDVHEARLVEEADSLRASNVLNVGTPINSAADEIFPFMLEDSTFYVASTRPDGREADRRDFDVLVLHRRQTLKQNITVIDIPQATLVGKVINTVTNMPVVDAEVIARLPQSTEVLASTRTDTAGSYRLRVPVERPVEITAQNEELFFDTFVTTIPASEQGRIVNPEKPLGLSPTFTLRVNFPTSVFDDPYPFSLDSNGTEIDRSWKRDVSDLVRNVKAGIGRIKKLVLTGHTDDVDTDESNLALSKKRVQFIIDRLVEGGLQAEILEGRSAGETQLLARRPDESVESWRRRCRRVELVKVQ